MADHPSRLFGVGVFVSNWIHAVMLTILTEFRTKTLRIAEADTKPAKSDQKKSGPEPQILAIGVNSLFPARVGLLQQLLKDLELSSSQFAIKKIALFVGVAFEVEEHLSCGPAV